MATNGRQKGKNGELELSKVLRGYGYDTHRGQQYCGTNGDADVVGLPFIHIECKRVERLNLYDAINQAVRDHKKGLIPAVFHRKNNCEWLVSMRLNDFMEIYQEWEAGKYLFAYEQMHGEPSSFPSPQEVIEQIKEGD